MQIEGNKRVFWGFLTPLRHLEEAFRSAGIQVDFELYSRMKTGKSLYISGSAFPGGRLINLNGRTPAQTVKDICCYIASGQRSCPYRPEEKGKEK
jgi:hypothetical protein